MTLTALAAPGSRLATLPEDLPELTLGYEAAAWAMRHLVHPNGRRAGQPWRFTPGQLDFLLHWYAVDGDGHWLYHHGVRRLAKGPIAHGTPVATPDGWVKHGGLSVGDRVFAADGSITTVVDVMPEVLEDCYRITFRDGEQIVCTGSHRWPVAEFTGASKRVERIATVAEMVAAGVTYARPLTAGKTKATRGGVARWRALPAPVLDGPTVDFPIPPYLLGYWLGDGDSDCPRITAHRDDLPSLLAEMDALGVEHGEPAPTHGETFRVRFGRGWATVALRAAGVLHDKHIPRRLMRASVTQRWEMLQGLVDSDGHIGKAGHVEICVMAGKLADDIEELATSLGLMPTRRNSDAVLDGRVVGVRARIKFSPLPGEVAARLPRKAARLRTVSIHAVPFGRSRTITAIEPVPTVPARCITVEHPSHQYLVGEKNVPTCNSGKSPFAAVVALIELCAPVRLADFDPAERGGCVGRPVDMPLVQIAATAESQTANTMRMVRALAPKGSKVVNEHALDPGLTRYYKAPVGTLEVITSSASAAEGAESTFVVADETEHWTPSNGGPELSNTLLDNLTKSGSRMLETCNAWVPGVQSVAEESYDAWVAQEDGRVRGSGRLLYDARVAPWDTDLADEGSLRAGLEYVYEDCWWQDIDPIIARIWSPKARPDDSRRKYLNQPTAAIDAWVTPQAWAVCGRSGVSVAPGEPIAMFFDGSRSRDATALIGCRMSDGHVFELGTWEPNPSHDTDDVVDVAAVDAAVAGAFATYDVVGFFADVKEWEGFTKISWPQAYESKLLVKAVPAGKDPQAIAWDMRSRVYEFGVACELTEAEINDKSLTHDGSAVLARHVGNARRHYTRGVVTLRKDSPDSPRKIDAAVAMVGARMVRRQVLASKEWQHRSRRSPGRGRVIAL